MTLAVITYIVYLAVCIGITYWVAQVLFSNARVFFDDIFYQDVALSESTNKLLKVGFYLVNIGFILFLLKTYNINTHKEVFEILSIKVGTVILILGTIYLTNVYLFFKLRKKARVSAAFGIKEDVKMQLSNIEDDELMDEVF